MSQLIGIDIGDREVKFVVCSGRNVKRTARVQLPDDLVSDGIILSMDAMADFLKESAKKEGIPRGDVSVLLPDELVFTRSTTVPVMTDQQLRYNLPYEFRDYLTDDKAKYFFDYIVEECVRDEQGRPIELRLFACAVLRSTVAEYRSMFRRAGFRLKCAIPAAVAISSAIGGNAKEPDLCFVDLGHRGTMIHILKGTEPNVDRRIDYGVRDIDRGISDAMSVDEHLARTYRESDYEGALSLDASKQAYNNIAVEIMKAVNFFNYNNREAELKTLYLCGGGANLPLLRDTIAETTGLELRSALEFVPSSLGDDALSYLLAYGCAVQKR